MNKTEFDQNHINARNEVLRKVGRNVYLFQRFERLLKQLNTISEISGHMSELEEKRNLRADEFCRLNMGPLVGQLMDNIYSGVHKSNSCPDELNEPFFSFSFKMQAEADFVDKRKQALKSFVEERNHLIHHFFQDFDINAIERYPEIERHLDEQRERILAEHEQLSILAKTYADSAQTLAEFLNSDEGFRKIQLTHFQQSNLASILIEVSINQARPDGWTFLNHAGSVLRKDIPQEMNNMKRQYGYKTLKAAVIGLDLFEIVEEETKQGGKRLLYRTRPSVLIEYLGQQKKPS